MAELTWDAVGDRYFYTGLDHGVFYPKDGSVGVPWNGLSAVTPKTSQGATFEQYWFGRKLYDMAPPASFGLTIEAYSSPEEADLYLGFAEDTVGFVYDNQSPQCFDMSYRTFVGNDTQGEQAAYQIHLHWDLTAVPTPMAYGTINDRPEAELLKWSATSRMVNWEHPVDQIGTFTMEQTGHVILDSRKLDPDVLRSIEHILYGDCFSDPRMPTLDELRTSFRAGYNQKGFIQF